MNKRIWVAVIIVLAFSTVFILLRKAFDIGTNNAPPANQQLLEARSERTANIWNTNEIDSAKKLVKQGDVVLRTGLGADSYMLMQMNLKDKTYSHCGIVMIENGYPFVYHSIGGEDNPDERLRRDSIQFFFSPASNLGFGIVRYNLDSIQINRLKKVVAEYYKAGKKFDLDFDLSTDDKLYCAEFVYKSLNRATEDSNYINTTHILQYTYVGIDNLFLNKHSTIIWQVKYK